MKNLLRLKQDPDFIPTIKQCVETHPSRKEDEDEDPSMFGGQDSVSITGK